MEFPGKWKFIVAALCFKNAPFLFRAAIIATVMGRRLHPAPIMQVLDWDIRGSVRRVERELYPEDFAGAAKMLPFYAERLSTTEINYTFHPDSRAQRRLTTG